MESTIAPDTSVEKRKSVAAAMPINTAMEGRAWPINWRTERLIKNTTAIGEVRCQSKVFSDFTTISATREYEFT